MNTIKFYYNGLKINGGNLQRCFYFNGDYTAKTGTPQGTIAICSKNLRFSEEIKEFFTVKNESDLMIDYFESDSILVRPDHALYPEVLKAFEDNAHKSKLKAEQRNKKHAAALVESCKAALPSLHHKLATANNAIDMEYYEKRIQETNKFILENS